MINSLLSLGSPFFLVRVKSKISALKKIPKGEKSPTTITKKIKYWIKSSLKNKSHLKN